MNDAAISRPAATDDDRLGTRIRAFISAPSGGDFDQLALAVHAYQYRLNAPYRRLADRLGAATPRHWSEIAAVPATAFKESVLACGRAERIYESSGTTEGGARRARHHVPDAALYRVAALAGFARAVLPTGERRTFIVAAPERTSHPASSLGEMVSWLRAAYDSSDVSGFLDATSALDLGGLAAALDALEPGQPIVLLTVTSALLRLVDHGRRNGRRWRLPAGSLVVDTGGCKGYAREVARAEIVDRYGTMLGVSPDRVVNEYGMTELCSQLYARGAGPFSAPPWMRTLVCDPLTGRPLPAGRAGLLRHFDLANLGSVLAVQTEDVGRVVDGGIELLGRAARAEARGCSLLVAP